MRSSNGDPKEDFYPPATTKRDNRSCGGYSLGIPGEVVKSIELSDNSDRWDALPIYLLRNPGLSARPVT